MHGQCTLKEEGVCDVSDYIITAASPAQRIEFEKAEETLWGRFSPRQMKFIEQCFRAGYAALQGTFWPLTPTGLIIQNSILRELLEK